MADKVAGIDVHKKVLMVVVMDARTPESKPERRRFTTMPGELRRVSTWLKDLGVEEAVMESTAQYWRSVWLALKGTEWAQAQVDTIRLKLFKVGGSHQRPARVAGTKLHLPVEEHLREGLQRAALLRLTIHLMGEAHLMMRRLNMRVAPPISLDESTRKQLQHPARSPSFLWMIHGNGSLVGIDAEDRKR